MAFGGRSAKSASYLNRFLRRVEAQRGVTHFEACLHAMDACLDRDEVLGAECAIHLPTTDFGYENTPQNSITLACMGVGGVHYALLAVDGGTSDEPPVVQVSPMALESRMRGSAKRSWRFLPTPARHRRDATAAVSAVDRAGTPVMVA